jgi:hypothetical protein
MFKSRLSSAAIFRSFLLLIPFEISVFFFPEYAGASSLPSDLVTITASVHATPPPWAVKERSLIDLVEQGARVYLNRYTKPDGTIYGVGDWDDVNEMFYNWSLFYAIGGEDSLFTWARKEYDALTQYCTHDVLTKNFEYYHELYYGRLDRGFPDCDDWFHMGEGFMLFYDIPIGNPDISELVERSRFAAGLYLNEGPGIFNYCPEYRVIRSTHTGTLGPDNKYGFYRYNDNGVIRESYEPLAAYRRIKTNSVSLSPSIPVLETNWDSTWSRYQQVMDIYNEIAAPCDFPINISCTAMFTNAFLYTGEEKYRQWVLDYVDAWIDRIEENGGVPPDNVGRTGKIGEYRNGQWWGGLWGWTTSSSISFNYKSLVIGAECAYLLSGNEHYLELIRTPIRTLLDKGVKSSDGIRIPSNYGPSGWTAYTPAANDDFVHFLDHLWNASLSEDDLGMIREIKNSSTRNWSAVPSGTDRNAAPGTSFARLSYYLGENTDWPMKILNAEYDFTQKTITAIKTDTRDIRTLNEDELYKNNPVVTKGLTQLTMGAPPAIYQGGLLRAQVRYFDTDRMRPGMPEDISALVEGISSDHITVTLINLNSIEPRHLIIQAGAFGEHRFTTVTTDEITTPVNSRYIGVTLLSGSGITLNLGIMRFVNTPSYAFPWQGGIIPAGIETEKQLEQFQVYQNSPNPFNPSTSLAYFIPKTGRVTVSVYNLAGQITSLLFDGVQNAGRYTLTWNGKGFAAGIYVCTMKYGSKTKTVKMTLLK